VGTGTDLPMLPEIAIRPQQPSRHVHDDFFPLLWTDRLGAHLRVLVVLVAEHHHRDQASAVLLVPEPRRIMTYTLVPSQKLRRVWRGRSFHAFVRVPKGEAS